MKSGGVDTANHLGGTVHGPAVQAGSVDVLDIRLPGSTAGAVRVPQQLPPVTRAFTDRQGDRERLSRVLAETHGAGDQRAGGPMAVSLHGATGIRQSTLAVRWVLDIVEQFPDGVLYARFEPVNVHARVKNGTDGAGPPPIRSSASCSTSCSPGNRSSSGGEGSRVAGRGDTRAGSAREAGSDRRPRRVVAASPACSAAASARSMRPVATAARSSQLRIPAQGSDTYGQSRKSLLDEDFRLGTVHRLLCRPCLGGRRLEAEHPKERAPGGSVPRWRAQQDH
ncbi:hypothetical protein FHX81_1250 [Saccharothrix saharensis]|uniref:Uncharacterized protein n=1 Tax=Saccharothrix saharensis TaxID=571190 RepID=A0A543J801_9PSEU|nr:hypothetical protein FHX81_1250 [Saccharothrix saharensis]